MAQLPDLKPDCAACAALCCVVFAFDRSESFAIDKAAGEVCPNLDGCGRCRVFDDRDRLGFHGCISYDCHGAGQVVTQEVFTGRSWRDDAALTERMGAALSVLRQVHEHLLLLETAGNLPLETVERDRLSELKTSLAPEVPWTETSLQDFPLESTIREVRAFLIGLRRHVAGHASVRS
ncbi:hypothetical protein [Roseibium sediminicola]|uniref:Pentapeptide repeat protein n=1 Tax=Roseibium sediminicola TaxID=2933272 RepID=A0ABT0GR94_9HYPH|nr:hypothetical protein [Roseibium sp. CAU 1639]MCK7611380.1 hypothetical protein [Roseibium sp. CAU 1639]